MEEHELTLAGERPREPLLELREHSVAADQCIAGSAATATLA
jgi:hypothetical protein